MIACALLSAHAAGSLLEAELLSDAPRGAATPPSPPEPPGARRAPPDGRGLVARNMFCATCTAATPGPGSTELSLDATLIATSIGDDSRATVRVNSSQVQGSFGLGDTIPGIGTLVRIGWISIDVADATGRRGTLALASAATPEHHEPAPARSPWADRVAKIDDRTFEVERDLVRELVTGSVKPGGTRVSAVTDQGKLTGLRLLGVGPETVAAAIGLRNGDTLSAVNNAQIESANTLLDLYAQLDQLHVVELAGTRDGKPLAITLRLR
ncbi:MAG TPA: hypothetical protein VLX92_35070 [Kofleriaceae bacterium]|nr:hypothetical protein [Kofleriaceae bacterium]